MRSRLEPLAGLRISFECENAFAFILSLFSLHVVTKKITPFVHMPVNFFKYLSLFLGWGGGGRRGDEMKKSLTFHFLHRLDWMLTGFFL